MPRRTGVGLEDRRGRRGCARFVGDGIQGGKWWLGRSCRDLTFLVRRPWWADVGKDGGQIKLVEVRESRVG